MEQPDGSLFLMGFGRVDRFNKVAPFVWEGVQGHYGRITFDAHNRSVLWLPGGTTLEFNTDSMADGRLVAHLTAIISSNGNRITLEYQTPLQEEKSKRPTLDVLPRSCGMTY